MPTPYLSSVVDLMERRMKTEVAIAAMIGLASLLALCGYLLTGTDVGSNVRRGGDDD